MFADSRNRLVVTLLANFSSLSARHFYTTRPIYYQSPIGNNFRKKREWEPKVRFVRAEASKMRIEVATNVQNQIKSHLFVSVFVSVACIARLHIAIQLLRIFCRS